MELSSDDSAAGDESALSLQALDGADAELEPTSLVRLMVQAMDGLGYGAAARQLEAESGVLLEPREVSALRRSLAAGDWPAVEALLPQPQLGIVDAEQLRLAQFAVRKQKFLELLEAGGAAPALECLRGELAPLGVNAQELQHLSNLLMCGDAEELYRRSGWSGTRAEGGGSRAAVLERLRQHVPPEVLLPPERLQTILRRSLAAQAQQCRYHNVPAPELSLFRDTHCRQFQLPSVTAHSLESHSDEVWCLQFNHAGARKPRAAPYLALCTDPTCLVVCAGSLLATGSKDGTCCIWDTRSVSAEPPAPVECLQVLAAPQSSTVGFVSWSPDDALLLTWCAPSHISSHISDCFLSFSNPAGLM